MIRNKVEIGLYVAGGVTLLSAVALWITRKKAPVPLFIAAGGLGASGFALRLYRREAGPFGLAEVSRVKRGDSTQRLWHDKEMGLEERIHLLQGLKTKSSGDPDVRRLALAITGYGDRTIDVGREKVRVKGKKCEARDDKCELEAIFGFTADPVNLRYTGDVGPTVLHKGQPAEAIDFFSTVRRAIEQRGEDCLPAGTQLLAEGHKFVAIEDLKPDMKIWGKDRWSNVEDVWYKGQLPVDAVQLNNGSWFKATGDHKVYVAKCVKHPTGRSGGKLCACDNRKVERIHVRDLEVGMVVVSPDRIAFGEEILDPDRALVEGFYLSDGWSSHNSRFDISGRDGHPKEAQKKLIEEVCARLGVRTTWHKKHISILDPEWTLRIQMMGSHAPQKHALSISLDEGAAGSLLRGIMADCGARDREFTTTSRMLAMQTRVLYKMFGVTCGEVYIENHGGLGTDPIWRLYPRRTDGTTNKKFIRVKSIERGVAVMPVYDLATDDHYVYLPEADVTVSNCDGHAVVNATLASLNGFTTRYRVTSNHGDSWDHIYTMVGLPKNDPKKWVAMDTTLERPKLGREPYFAKHKDFEA